MSNFKCEKCDKDIIDSENRYVTGCEHYPVENKSLLPCPKFGSQILDPFGQGKVIHDVLKCWGVK